MTALAEARRLARRTGETSASPAAGQVFTYRLVRVVNRLNRHAAAFAAEQVGLSLPEWRCLFLIAPRRSLYVQELLTIMSETKGLVSRSLSALEAKGLVALNRDSDDKRQLVASVTAKGARLHARTRPAMEARERWLLSRIGAADRAAVTRTVATLNEALDRWERDRAPSAPSPAAAHRERR